MDLEAFIKIIKKLNYIKFMLNALSKSLQFIVKLFKIMFGALINLLDKLIKEILSLDDRRNDIIYSKKYIKVIKIYIK